jgi:hypothetical protein
MNGLLLLKEPADWEKFKAELMVAHGIDRSAMTWGSQSSPVSYPCLSSGVIVNSSVVCVFVYVDDAKKLLDVLTAHPEEIDFGSIVPEASETGAWNRHMVAIFLAILHEMISVGITKEERFEALMVEMLERVDLKHATDLHKMKELIDREFRGNAK